jgi:hypothetical protein
VFAQDTLKVISIPTVRVYIAPMESGTPEEQEYFMASMKMELIGAAYQVVDSMEDSDYNVVLSVSHDEESTNMVYFTLFDTKSGQEIVSVGRDYQQFSDMDEWNLYLISQATANLPIIRLPVGAELVAVREGEGSEEKPPYKPGFYLGLRAGGSLNISTFQTFGNYDARLSLGFAGEGAVLVEFRFVRFLSLQAEAVFVYDSFGAGKKIANESEQIHSTDNFWHLSLIFPVLIKIPVELNKFTLSPFMGVYYIMSLGQMNRVDDDSDEDTEAYPYEVNVPFGISLGIDAGVILGPGELFIGLRFDQDLGMTTVGDYLSGPQYSRNRIGLSLGYEFLLGKKRR